MSVPEVHVLYISLPTNAQRCQTRGGTSEPHTPTEYHESPLTDCAMWSVKVSFKFKKYSAIRVSLCYLNIEKNLSEEWCLLLGPHNESLTLTTDATLAKRRLSERTNARRFVVSENHDRFRIEVNSELSLR